MVYSPLSYIIVSDALIKRFCREESICFWASMAIISPIGTDESFLFDCSLSRFLKKEYANKRDSRLLFSFKSPYGINKLYFGSKLSFKELEADFVCSKKNIEDYLKTLIEETKQELANIEKNIQGSVRTSLLSRILFPFKRDHFQQKGVYYGYVVKSEILGDMTRRLGFENNVLNADVKKGYVMVSFDPRNFVYHGLIVDKSVRLDVYRKLLNHELLISTLHGTSL